MHKAFLSCQRRSRERGLGRQAAAPGEAQPPLSPHFIVDIKSLQPDWVQRRLDDGRIIAPVRALALPLVSVLLLHKHTPLPLVCDHQLQVCLVKFRGGADLNKEGRLGRWAT